LKLYTELASRITARNNAYAAGNDWWRKHQEVIDQLIDMLPHGSGIDGKTELLLDECKPYDKPVKRIVIASSYHAMNDDGYYDGWYDFKLIITPSFDGIDMKVTGKFGKYSDVKDYLWETFYFALTTDIEVEAAGQDGVVVRYV